MRPGVSRALDVSGAEVLARAEAEGAAALILDSTGDRTTSAFLTTAGRVLGAGDEFGHNLDALYDVLRDLDDPAVLVWSGWADLALADPRAFTVLVGLFADRSEEAALSVVLVGQGPAVDVPLLP
ncbi:barstar family protein [Nocardioides sp.]|uniref:barstar family protein n=1 Tax=Nocardioides sp. TaxID=35761 RepID=UPI002612AD98|nr:barstar family protein [Nocardioides sp.]